MKVTTTIAALLIATLPGIALAQPSTTRIDQRQEIQKQRIEQGVQSGQLTSREAANLEKGQGKVQKMEDRALKDGTLTNKERARIEHAQDKQDKKIYREKHDKQTVQNEQSRKEHRERQHARK